MRTAAVIGPRSMLGAEMVRRLKESGVHVLGVGRSKEDDIFLDLETQLNELPSGLRADAVFHCAAHFGDDSQQGLTLNLAMNTASAGAVTSLMARMEAATLIYAGSMWSNPTADSAGLNSYGLTKGLAEQIFSWSAQRNGSQFVSLRFPQLFDVEGRCCVHQPWFGRIIAYAVHGKDLRMPASLGPRNFLHVSDAADLMISAGALDGVQTVPVCHPELLTYDEIAEIAYRTFGKGGGVRIAAEKTPFRAMNFPDTGETFELLKMRPAISMREGVELIRQKQTGEMFGPMDVT